MTTVLQRKYGVCCTRSKSLFMFVLPPQYSCTLAVPGSLGGCKLMNLLGLNGAVQPHSRFWRRGRQNRFQVTGARCQGLRLTYNRYPGVGGRGGGVTKALTDGDVWAEGFGPSLRVGDSRRSPLVLMYRHCMYIVVTTPRIVRRVHASTKSVATSRK